MRIVVDLNTLVSGLLWRGTSRQLLDLTRAGRFELLTSAILLTELDDVLHRSKFAAPLHRAQLSADSLVADIARIAVLARSRSSMRCRVLHWSSDPCNPIDRPGLAKQTRTRRS